MKALLPLCPALQTLDIAYTAVRSLDVLSHLICSTDLTLQKLSVSGLSFRTLNGLERFFRPVSLIEAERRNALEVLKLGTLDLDNPTLMKILPYLEYFQGLRKVSLFGNTKLASGLSGGLKRFISSIGRNCLVSWDRCLSGREE